MITNKITNKPFNSIEELQSLFDLGVMLKFTEKIDALGQVEYLWYWDIYVNSNQTLEEQKITIMHEFFHAYNDPYLSSSHQEDLDFNVHEFCALRFEKEIMQSHALLIDEIVEELIKRPNCGIFFQNEETPFFDYCQQIKYRLSLKK